MTLAIQLEIGHDASVRNKTTPEGFTHDWEVFVRGSGGTEIHHYIEKVVFHLHETFQKPRRVVKEPPFSLRTSGYAGFTLPIEIHLRNNQEPKKIWFTYELVLQPSGPPIHNVQKEKYIFHNPSDDFRSRLLKGGALVSSSGICQENSSSSSKVDDRNQMISKPRLSGSDLKKQKMKHDEPKTSDFLNLFGPPITKTSKSLESTKPKDAPKQIPKPENKGDKEKDKFDKSKSAKSSHKEREKDKEKSKERSSTENNEKKNKDEKNKSKERECSKDKIKKERERSPTLPSHSPSPKRSPKRASSPVLAPALSKTVLAREKEYNRGEKKDKEKLEKRDKKEEKKTKKDKKDHKDKDNHKERDTEKEHKEYKNKEIKPNKEISNFKSKDPNINAGSPIVTPVVNKIEKKEKIKEKESPKESSKEEDRNRPEKLDDKSQKHKHKKKDKKEKREERHTKCDKKSEKQSNSTNKFREMIKEPSIPVMSNRESDKNNLFGSPKSEPPSTPDQETVKTENIVSFKDDDYSINSTRRSSQETSPLTKAPSRSPSPLEIEPAKKVELEKVKAKEESPKKKEKKEKKKDKKNDKDFEKKRKRKSETVSHVSQESGEPLEKIIKEEENNNSDDESKVSSTEDIIPIPKSECDMDILRDLQHKIMSLKDNADLQKVVQLIAETGQYEVSANTVDFDLCLLDKSTVKQLQDFFSTVS